jgi:hypothetical protein
MYIWADRLVLPKYRPTNYIQRGLESKTIETTNGELPRSMSFGCKVCYRNWVLGRQGVVTFELYLMMAGLVFYQDILKMEHLAYTMPDSNLYWQYLL